jgi:sigma-B regulation protein RsbU (phosphoserine phosphatase)
MNSLSQAVSIQELSVAASLGNLHLCSAPSLDSDIQNTLVPALTYQAARLEAHGQSLPKDDVGGDLVDLITVDSGVVAYVADVSGHGLRAGVLMGMIKTAVRYGLLLHQPVAKLLQDINRVLPAIKDPCMFATLAALRFDGSNITADEVEYISAGHFPLLHYRRLTRDIVRYANPEFPLGLFAEASYVSQRIHYETGDIFALVTDGFVEVGEDHDADLGLERLSQILRQNAERSLSEIVESIYSDLARHGTQHDDQTILLVRALKERGLKERGLKQQGLKEHDGRGDHQRISAPNQPTKSADFPDPLEASWRKLLDDLAAELSRD